MNHWDLVLTPCFEERERNEGEKGRGLETRRGDRRAPYKTKVGR